MAEYIEKQKLLNDAKIRQNDSGIVRTNKLRFRNYYKQLPTADVVEREKIDKAIEEIHSYKHGNGNMFDCGMLKAIEILKRNIGEQ